MKTTPLIFTKFGGNVAYGPRKKQILVVIRIVRLRVGLDGINILLCRMESHQMTPILHGKSQPHLTVCFNSRNFEGSTALVEVCAQLSDILVIICFVKWGPIWAPGL